MTHELHVTLMYNGEFNEEEELVFMLTMGRVPSAGESLSFEAPPSTGLDQVNMTVTEVTEGFYLGTRGSRPLTEIEASVNGLSARPVDRDVLVGALAAHSVVSGIEH